MSQKLLVFVLVIFTLICSSLGAVSIAQVKENPEYPGKCWEDHYKQAIDVGGAWQPHGNCESIACSKSSDGDGKSYIISYTGCGLIGKSDEYEIVQDLSLPHPNCCPTIRPYRTD